MSSGNDNGGRTKRITFYVSEDERQALRREANDEGKSLSKYVLDLVRKQRRDEGVEELSENLKVEERLKELVTEATEDIEESAAAVEKQMKDVKNIHATMGTYPVVNFRALKREFDLPEPWIDDEFRKASEKLKVDPDDAPDESDERADGKATDVDDLV